MSDEPEETLDSGVGSSEVRRAEDWSARLEGPFLVPTKFGYDVYE